MARSTVTYPSTSGHLSLTTLTITTNTNPITLNPNSNKAVDVLDGCFRRRYSCQGGGQCPVTDGAGRPPRRAQRGPSTWNREMSARRPVVSRWKRSMKYTNARRRGVATRRPNFIPTDVSILAFYSSDVLTDRYDVPPGWQH